MNTISFLDGLDFITRMIHRFDFDLVTKPMFKPNFSSRIYNNGCNTNPFISIKATNNTNGRCCELFIAHHKHDNYRVVQLHDVLAGDFEGHHIDEQTYEFIKAYMHKLNEGIAKLNEQS